MTWNKQNTILIYVIDLIFEKHFFQPVVDQKHSEHSWKKRKKNEQNHLKHFLLEWTLFFYGFGIILIPNSYTPTNHLILLNIFQSLFFFLLSFGLTSVRKHQMKMQILAQQLSISFTFFFRYQNYIQEMIKNKFVFCLFPCVDCIQFFFFGFIFDFLLGVYIYHHKHFIDFSTIWKSILVYLFDCWLICLSSFLLLVFFLLLWITWISLYYARNIERDLTATLEISISAVNKQFNCEQKKKITVFGLVPDKCVTSNAREY